MREEILDILKYIEDNGDLDSKAVKEAEERPGRGG